MSRGGGIASIPLVSSSTDGAVPAGATVSTQDQTTKFLREDGSWAVPSYTTKTDKANVDGSNITNAATFRSNIYVPTYNFANLNRPNMHLIIAKVLISVSNGTGTFDMTPYLPTGMMYSTIVFANATSTQSLAVTGATIDFTTNILTVKVSNQSASASTDFNVLAFAI